MRHLLTLIDKRITMTDTRTGVTYTAQIRDVKSEWGRIRITCDGRNWFEPSKAELESAS